MHQGEEKTEEATPRRKERAYKEGQIAISAELSRGLALAVALYFWKCILPFWDFRAHALDPIALAYPILAFTGICLLINVCVTGLQTKFHTKPLKLNTHLFKPPFSNFSQAANNAFLAFAKVACIGCLIYYLMKERMTTVLKYAQINTTSLYQTVDYILSPLLYALVLCNVALGIADYFWKWMQNKRQLRMSKYEVKREMMEQEGNPTIKFKRRQFHEKIARKMSLSDATIVLTNPTHVAVALYWDRTDAPPALIDKTDQHVKQFVAAAHNAPMVRIPEIARGLYRDLEPGDYITEQYYDSVADILSRNLDSTTD